MNLFDLVYFLRYVLIVPGDWQNVNPIPKGLLDMKLAVRVLALMVVVAGFAAASLSSASTKTVVSHQSATASFPAPGCVPGFPTCISGVTR
jgi:hypothetical protein